MPILNFYVGTTKFDTGEPVEANFREHWEAELVNIFGGFSRSIVVGTWRNDNGTIIREDSYKYEIGVTALYAERRIKEMLEHWEVMLSQDKIGMTVIEATTIDF